MNFQYLVIEILKSTTDSFILVFFFICLACRQYIWIVLWMFNMNT